MPTVELYPFRYRQSAHRHVGPRVLEGPSPVIQRLYEDWEIIGPADLRHVAPGAIKQFNPFSRSTPPVCIAPASQWAR